MAIISDAVKKEMLSWKADQLTITFIANTFGSTATKKDGKVEIIPPRISTKDTLTLRPGEYTNSGGIKTTAGLFLFNKIMIEGPVAELLRDYTGTGYVNHVMTKDNFTKHVLEHIQRGIMEDKIDIDPDVVNFLRAYENYGLKLSAVFAPSFGLSIIKPREDLVRRVKSAKVSTLADMTGLEDEVVSQAEKDLKDDPALSIYKSGARGNMKNNYKNMSLVIGPVKNEATGKYDMIYNNLVDGLRKEDLVGAGNMVINSAYPTAIGTAQSGYLTKQFQSAYQGITLGPPRSDCGTTKTLTVELSSDVVVEMFKYQYIKEGSKYVLLTDANKRNYKGKTVEFRSPMFCLNKQPCNRCSGDVGYAIGINNIGLTSATIASVLLKKKLKAKHDSSIKMTKIDINRLII